MEYFSYTVPLGQFADTLAADSGRFYTPRTIEDTDPQTFSDRLREWGEMIADWFGSITGSSNSDEIVITGKVPEGTDAGAGNRVVYWRDGVISLYDSSGNHVGILTPTTQQNANFVLNSRDKNVDVTVGFKGGSVGGGASGGSESTQYFILTPGTGR